MTPDHIFNDMTWAEVGDCLDYINMYEANERHWAIKPFSRNKKWNKWMNREDDNFDKQLKDFQKSLKK